MDTSSDQKRRAEGNLSQEMVSLWYLVTIAKGGVA
jgi:hypothetical protein